MTKKYRPVAHPYYKTQSRMRPKTLLRSRRRIRNRNAWLVWLWEGLFDRRAAKHGLSEGFEHFTDLLTKRPRRSRDKSNPPRK